MDLQAIARIGLATPPCTPRLGTFKLSNVATPLSFVRAHMEGEITAVTAEASKSPNSRHIVPWNRQIVPRWAFDPKTWRAEDDRGGSGKGKRNLKRISYDVDGLDLGSGRDDNPGCDLQGRGSRCESPAQRPYHRRERR